MNPAKQEECSETKADGQVNIGYRVLRVIYCQSLQYDLYPCTN